MKPTGKDLVEELQARSRRTRAVDALKVIKKRSEAMRQVFAKSSCDVCGGPLVRHEGGLGFVCEAGHAADTGAAKRRRDAGIAASAKAAARGMEIVEARLLQARRGRP